MATFDLAVEYLFVAVAGQSLAVDPKLVVPGLLGPDMAEIIYAGDLADFVGAEFFCLPCSDAKVRPGKKATAISRRVKKRALGVLVE